MTTLDLSQLETLARAATPGEWHACKDGECICGQVWSIPADCIVHLPAEDNDFEDTAPTDEQNRANSRYIAAANPATVLALVERLQRAEAALQTIVDKQKNGTMGYTSDHEAGFASGQDSTLEMCQDIARAALVAIEEAKP